MYTTPEFTVELQANIIRDLFRSNGCKEQTLEEGLALFILLELVHFEKKAVRCMSYKQTGSKQTVERCAGEIKSSELVSNMIELFHVVRDPRLQGENLAHKVYQIGSHFLCSHHRKHETTEQLTLNWFPLIAQHRDLYPLPTFVSKQDPQLLHPTLMPQPQYGQLPVADVKPSLLPSGEAVAFGA